MSRQLALLLTVYLTPPPHTVRGLAETLNVAKPVVISGNLGDDAKNYQVRAVQLAIEEVKIK